jgi:hypothetical protein
MIRWPGCLTITSTAIVLGLLAVTPAAQARTDTGYDLLTACRPFKQIARSDENTIQVPESPDLMECWGYMSAVMDFANFTANGERILGVCSQGGRRISNYIQAFLDYADKHPDELHQNAALVTIRSLKEAFPCP